MIFKFHTYLVMIEHCTECILYKVDLLRSPPCFFRPLRLKYQASHIYTCGISPSDWINQETVQNQIKNFSIISPNQVPSFIKCHRTHAIKWEILALLPRSMVTHACKSNTFISIRTKIPWTVLQQEQSSLSYCGRIHALLERAWFPSFSGTAYFTKLNTVWGVVIHSNTHVCIFCLLLFIHNYPSTSNITWNISTTSAIDANVSGIAKSHVPADQPASLFSVRTATSRRSDIFLPSRLVVGSNIQAWHREVAATEQQLTFGTLTSRMYLFLLIRTRSERVIQELTSLSVCSKTRLLSGNSCPTNNYTSLKSSVTVSSTTDKIELPSLPTSKVSSMSQLPCHVIFFVSETP